MKYTRKLVRTLAATLITIGSLAGGANAAITITVTENTTLGGTNWTFDGGSGLVVGGGNNFLVGATPANPQDIHLSDAEQITVALLSGSNSLGVDNIFVRNYGGLPGTNGDIFDGFDFQGVFNISGIDLSTMNGTVLHAPDFDIGALNNGTFSFDSYYTPYGTNLGVMQVNVGVVPEPSSSLLVCLGALGLVARRRRIK